MTALTNTASTAIYRIRQGMRALLAAVFIIPIDYEFAARYLSPALLGVFKQMKRGEQVHSLHVLRAVLAQEPETPPALAIAALMHDCGKIRYPVAIWGKTIAVLTRKFSPAQFDRLSKGDPEQIFARPFVVYQQHPAWSGELLAQHDAPQDAIWLAQHHADDLAHWQNHALYHLLCRLHQADDTN